MDAILADCVSVQARTQELMSLLQAENLHLEAAQTRTIELCALGQRRERVRLDTSRLCATVSGAPQASRLGSGSILPPLASRAEGERQAARLHELGHSMYLPAQVAASASASASGTASVSLTWTRGPSGVHDQFKL